MRRVVVACALAVISTLVSVPARAQIRQENKAGLRRCKPRHSRDPAVLMTPAPLEQCPRPSSAWCDKTGELGLCCEPGTTYDGLNCGCDAKHHPDSGHCCASGEHWINPTGMGHGLGRCCAEGLVGVEGRVYSTDIGMVGGGVVGCCRPGQLVDNVGCYDPMPCQPIEHKEFEARARFIGCGDGPLHRKDSGGKAPLVTLGPTTGSDRKAADLLRAALKNALPKLRACYAEALADAPDLAGLVDAELSAAPNGELRAHRIVPAAGPQQPALIECVVRFLQEDARVADVPPGVPMHAFFAFQHPEAKK